MLPLFLVANAIGGLVGEFLLTIADGMDLDETNVDGQTVSFSLTVNTDGSITTTADNQSPAFSNESYWTPLGEAPGAGVYVRLNFTSGTNQVTSGAVGSWLELTSSRSWTFTKVSAGGPDSTNGVYNLLFSLDGGSTTIDSATLDDVTLTESAP